MPLFRYSALDSSGAVVEGTYNADSVAQVEAWLEQRNMAPISIEVGEAEGSAGAGWWQRLQARFTPISLEDRILFCRQVGAMFGAGISILRIFETIVRQLKNPRLKGVVEEILEDVRRGDPLSEAFGRHRDIFDDLFINLVRVGEESGNLPLCFNYLAELYENEKATNERIKSATRYPKIVVTAIFLAVSFLMTFVVPKFVDLFRSSHVPLPLPTRILVAVSGFFANYFIFIFLGVGAAIAAYRWAMNYEGPRSIRDRFLLKMPIIGELSKKIYLARYCRITAVLMRSGIDIIRTLELAAHSMRNLILRRMALEVMEAVRVGASLDEAMERQPHFTPLVVQMVAAGVESGQVDDLLNRVADYYDMESDYTIRNLSTLIEPILIAVLGAIVGFIALAIFLPMWSMMEVMRGG